MSKSAVFSFGRFNPPTKGHQHMIEWADNFAHIRGADYFLYPSPSVHKIPKSGIIDPLKVKNPIPFAPKTAVLRRLFPTINIIQETSVYSPQQVIAHLDSQGYTDVTFVVGSDRLEEFRARWLPYAVEELNYANVVSAAKRIDDAEGIAGMSGSKARQYALDGDFGGFTAAVGWKPDLAYELYNAVREGMGLSVGAKQSV